VRIVAGTAKGRRLAAPADGTRPTSDRVREAMFNTLSASIDLTGARVLDLFAGTGAVGLEALSRGAGQAVLVEQGRAALTVLRRNVEAVGLPGASVVARPVRAALAAPPDEQFDVVFADPPYAYGDKIYDVIAALRAHEWLAPDAWLILETSGRSKPIDWADESITHFTEKRYGDTVLWYGRRR
jgi:16S rRNA (guanine966-N2)-methyltransferase